MLGVPGDEEIVLRHDLGCGDESSGLRLRSDCLWWMVLLR